MKDSHGTLENEILNVIWKFEENNCPNEISVNDVFNMLNASSSPRAYTTIKTVMDRLVEKNLLIRTKGAKRYVYSSTESREELGKKALQKLVKQYYQSDIRMLLKAVEKECLTSSTR